MLLCQSVSKFSGQLIISSLDQIYVTYVHIHKNQTDDGDSKTNDGDSKTNNF